MSNLPNDEPELKPPLTSATIRRAIYGIIAFLAIVGVRLTVDNAKVEKAISGGIAIIGILTSLGVIHGRVNSDTLIDTEKNQQKLVKTKIKIAKRAMELSKTLPPNNPALQHHPDVSLAVPLHKGQTLPPSANQAKSPSMADVTFVKPEIDEGEGDEEPRRRAP